MTGCDEADFPMDDSDSIDALADWIERDLFARHGPLLADDALRIALGYRSMEAFRQALVRKTVPIPVFSLDKRRGKFALAKDVARWLARQRNAAVSDKSTTSAIDPPAMEGEPP